MRDKTLQIRADDDFLAKVEYLRDINGWKTTSKTVRKIIEKEYEKESKKKTGYWIRHDSAEEANGRLIPNFECSECHAWKKEMSGYCPDCGIRILTERGIT